MIRPVTRTPKQVEPLSIKEFKGMDITSTRDVRRSPDMMNCILDDEGTPEMRTGYEKAFATSLGAGPILGIHKWTMVGGAIRKIIHHGTKLYTCDALGDVPALSYTGLSGLRHSISFTLGNKLCILDGTVFLVYDGTTFTSATASAYVPTRYIGTPPAGGGTVVEDFNLLSSSWRQKFSTVSGTTAYTAAHAPFDSILEVRLNNVVLANPAGYTVNLTTGVITLAANPGAGTNNLEVIPVKSAFNFSTRITKCTTAQVYGGPSDSRVFLTGNPDYPHIDWWTGLPLSGAFDPTYWPDTNYDRIGGDDDPMMGYAVQYDRMVVFKRKSIYLRSWEITTDAYGRTVTRFPAVPLNNAIGAYDADSIVLVENNPMFVSDNGVYSIMGTNVRDERNVEELSTLVKIKASGHAAAIDFDGKVYITYGSSKVWVCDYNRQVKDENTGRYVPVWYPWSAVPAITWCELDGQLIFGSDSEGMVYRFKKKTDSLPYNDNGAVIDAYFKGISTTFDKDSKTKLVQGVNIMMKPFSRAQITTEYATEEGYSFNVQQDRMDLIDFGNVDFGNFTFDTSRSPKDFKVRIDDARNIQRFQIVLKSSGVVDDFFGFESIDIAYQILSEVR